MKNLLLIITFIVSLSCDINETTSRADDIILSESMTVNAMESQKDSVSLTQRIQNLKDYSNEYYSYPIKFPEGYTFEEYAANEDGFKAFQGLNKLLKVYLEEDTDLNREAIKEFVSTHKDEDFYFQLAQWSALTILDQKLLKKENPDKENSNIAYYTKILIEQEYNHSEIIARSIHVLKGYWTEEYIMEIAKECLKRTSASNSNHNSSNPAITKSDLEGNQMLKEIINSL